VAAQPKVVSFYRADTWRVLGRSFLFSGVVMTLGALSVAASFVYRSPAELHETIFAVGIVLVIVGGLTTIVRFTRALRDETCVVARTDGIVVQADGRETFFAWGDLARVRFDEVARVLVLERTDGTTHHLEDRRYGDATAGELAKQLDDLRRKAGWNLLRAG
jgi:hypothetical protein